MLIAEAVPDTKDDMENSQETRKQDVSMEGEYIFITVNTHQTWPNHFNSATQMITNTTSKNSNNSNNSNNRKTTKQF